jgi:hypothetical protein
LHDLREDDDVRGPLTDFLNGQERFRIHHVEFESLEDGHKVAIDSVSVVP